MKKLMKHFIHVAAAVIAGTALLFSATSCDQLQSMLSSEQSAELTAETGTASLGGITWYYNGSTKSDMSATTDNFLCVSFDQKVALSSTGLSGSFVISYTDANGDSAELTKALDGGSLSSNGDVYYLNMAPVVSMLNTSIAPSGTLSVLVTVGGFVRAEGDQKGRDVATLKKVVAVEPLFSDLTLSGVTFNTLYSTADKSIEIPLKGAVSLASDASVEVIAAKGSSLPDGLTTADFSTSLSADGLTLYVTPDVELNQKSFAADVTVSGIVPALNGSEKTQTFPVTFIGALMSTDNTLATTASYSGLNAKINSVTLSNDDTNVYVSVGFDGVPTGWENDHISILIDDANLETGSATYTDSTDGAPASYLTVGSTVEFFGYEVLKSGSPVNMTSDTTWTQNTSDWKWYGSNATVKYTIPFASIGTNVATSSDTLRVVVFFSAGWSGSIGDSHVYSAVPAAAATVTKKSGDADTLAIDFSKALCMTIGSTGEKVTYATPVAPSAVIATTDSTADTTASATNTLVSLVWSKVYSAATYNVYRKAGDAEYGTAIATVTGASTYTDATALPATAYTYKVTAANASGESTSGAETTITTKTLPTPATPVASSSFVGTTVTVSWAAVDYAVKYNVYRSDASDGTYEKVGESTTVSYTDTVTANFAYYYKVSAVNYSGTESAQSTAAFVSDKYPTAFTISEAHTATTVTITNGTSTNAETYTLYYKLSSDTDFTKVDTLVAAATKTVTGLTMGKKYNFKVVATNSLTTEIAGTYAVATVDAGPLYPTITLDGTLEEAWNATDGSVVSSSDTLTGVNGSDGSINYDIDSMYVTNDATNLYVVLKFANGVAKTWKGDGNERVTLLVDNDAVTTGDTSFTGSWDNGIATTVTISNGSVEGYVTDSQSTWARTGNITNVALSNSWAYDGTTYLWSSSSQYFEYKIPLSSIGSPASGTAVKLVGAFSRYVYSNNTNCCYVADIVPSASATITEDTTNSVTNGIVTIDMTQALSYTIK